jgi:O-glycosyl hydrolase
MWQAETFDTITIDKELALAGSIGFNTLRVFLHDKLWQQNADGFKKRVDIFLHICARHGIRPMLVFFDSCWDPFPKTGKQHPPEPGLHNSGWVQSPGADILTDTANYDRLKQYVKGIINAFKNDKRILCWDLWNEPDNTNGSSYGKKEPANKVAFVNRLLPMVFEWARSEGPSQPLTSGLWTWWNNGWDKDSSKNLTLTEKIQLQQSDIITFHCYNDSTIFKKQMKALLEYGKPVICTEYMARGEKNTVITVMPIAKRNKVGMINWGFADGKEQTKYPWDSWEKRYAADPPLWHHILFKSDYTPYKQEEIDFIKTMTGKKK